MSAGGVPRGASLAEMIAAVPPRDRDAYVDELLRTPALPRPAARAVQDDDELIDCIPSGVAGVVRALVAAEVGPDDVFVDVGAGLGTVAILAHLLTGARATGIEIQPALVGAASERARDLGIDGVAFVHGDARATLPEGTVYYLYTPFMGASMQRARDRLRAEAGMRQIAICTLGFDLGAAEWLRVVDDDSIFLTVHESVVPGVAPRRRSAVTTAWLRPLAELG